MSPGDIKVCIECKERSCIVRCLCYTWHHNWELHLLTKKEAIYCYTREKNLIEPIVEQLLEL